MINIDIRADLRGMQRQLDRLSASLQDRVVAAAVNKTADKARVEMRRQITAEFAIKAADVNSQVKLKKAIAKSGMLWAELEAFPRRRGHLSRNVMLFGAKQTKQGVTVRIKKSGGRKLIKHAFIANKGRTVFTREGTKRLPIKPVETIDVPQMFNTRRINANVLAKIKRDFSVEIQRALAAANARGWT